MYRKVKIALGMTIQDLRGLLWTLLVNVIAASIITPRALRYLIYRTCGIKTETTNIFSGCYIRAKKLSLGKDTFLNNRCFIENNAAVSIGNNCAIGMETLIGSDTHEPGETNQRAGKAYSLPITIGDGCWIGARATILAGVTIAKGCVIAAGAVVTKDCEANGLYAGVPAIRIKDLP